MTLITVVNICPSLHASTDAPRPMTCNKKISVSAAKKDVTDKGLVQIRITTIPSGSQSNPGEMISESVFEKNTNGLRVNKLYFCFPPGAGDNRVLARFKKKGGEWGPVVQATNVVSSADNISKIIVDTKADPLSIEYVYKKVTKPTMTVSLKLPSKSGSWRIVRGNQDMSESAAKNPRKDSKTKEITEEGILLPIITATKNQTMKIYKITKPAPGKPEPEVRIFAENQSSGTNHFNKFSLGQVEAAGSKPVLVIDNDAVAKLMSAEEYKKLPPPTTAAKTPATIASASAALTPESTTTTDFLARYTAETLPAHIDLKILLTSLVPTQYKPAVTRLLKASDRLSRFKAIMDEHIDENLLLTPLVKWKMKFHIDRSAPDDVTRFKNKIAGLQPEYAKVYSSLKSESDKVDPALQSSLERLRTELKEALLPG